MIEKAKWLGIFGIVVIALISGIYFTTSGLKAEVYKVKAEDFITLQQEEGWIVPAAEAKIFAPYGGKVTRLPITEGELVAEGDLLASLEGEELQFQLKQINAQLKALQGEEGLAHQQPLSAQLKSQKLLLKGARQQLKKAQTELTTAKSLYQEGAITFKELEYAQELVADRELWLKQQEQALALLKETHSPNLNSIQVFEGRREALEAQRDLLQSQIDKSNLLAPFTGVVTNLTVDLGDLVMPGQILMKLLKQDKYLVETYLPADVSVEIQVHMPIRLIQIKGGEEIIFPGEIISIAPTAEEKMSTLGLLEQRIKVTILPTPPSHIKLIPGTTIDVEFATQKRENVLYIPLSTIFPYQDQRALWLIENGKAKIQIVETGLENNQSVIITKGLKEGDLIIKNPQLEGLKEGKSIKILGQ